MGDFSRDPAARLQDSVAKHYVGVRLQQGVPILDTDWNELEDLRRHEVAALFTEYIGDGVPADNDGFRIDALANGGVGTIVLTVVHDPVEPSSVAVDPSASTAMSALGFLPGTVEGHPGRLTGTAATPFALTNGSTLTIVVNGESETATFDAADDFEDIRVATAAEVAAVLNAAFANATAGIGTGGEFLIRGGNGTLEGAGRLLAGGKEALVESSLVYSSQRLFQNPRLADAWGVSVIEPLTMPAGTDRVDTVYIDVWDREVDSAEDDAFVLPAVGIESTVRLRREWAVRVAEDAADLSGIARMPEHTYLPLARIQRAADDASIPVASITDLRKRRLTLAEAIVSPILVKGELNLDRVNSALFAAMLRTTGRVYGELLGSDFFLATNFDNITAVESVIVLRAFQDVRFLAESGITDAALRRFDNAAALAFMRRLYDIQRAFVDALMILADDGSTQRLPTRTLLQELDSWLEGDGAGIAGLRPAVLPAESPDLGDAYDAQIFINNLLGLRVGVLPRGHLTIEFVSGPAGPIDPGSVHTFTYSITSVLTADDTLVLALADTAGVFDFAFQELPQDPGSPGDASRALLELAQGATALVSFELIVPAAVPIGTQSRLVLTAVSETNPEEIDFANISILVEVGDAIQPPHPEVGLQFLSGGGITNLATDVAAIGTAPDTVAFLVRATNNSAATQAFQFSVEFVGHPDSYEVVDTTVLNPTNIADGAFVDVPITIEATGDATAGEDESLMVIRLTRTADGAFQELHIRVVPDVGI